MKNIEKITKNKLFRLIAIVILIIILGNFFLKSNKSSASDESSDITEIDEPIARQDINQEFKFPIKDSRNVQLGEITYAITDVEIRDQIIIQGKKYGSVEGRTFAIFSLKITNEFDQSIEVNSRNYMRLSTNGSEEWLAPDTHNDPVSVQAISTKPTRVAFTIDDDAKDLVLQVGEIKGEKQKIELNITP